MSRKRTAAEERRVRTAAAFRFANMAVRVAGVTDDGGWVPASGGTEEPFKTRDGRRLQYMWQPNTGKHAYLDLDSDIFLSDDEAGKIVSSASSRR